MLKRKIALILATTMLAGSISNVVMANEKPNTVGFVEGASLDSEITSRSATVERMYTIGDTVSESYKGSTSDWQVLDNVCYGVENNDFTQLQMEDYIATSTAIAIKKTAITDWERITIALSSIGVDVTKLVDETGADVNLIEKIANGNASSLNGAVFGVLAYDSGNYAVVSGNTRESMIKTILSSQLEDKGWTFWGNVADPDMTGMAISALAPYYFKASHTEAGLSQETYVALKVAVDEALEKLGQMQSQTGAWASYGSDNANSTAMALIALCSMGIDPMTDTRFIKAGNTAIDGLMVFALEDNTGFWYNKSTTINAGATEQAFRAIAAYKNFTAQNKPYNLYSNSYSEKQELINVTVTIIGDETHGVFGHTEYAEWLKDYSFSTQKGSTVAEVLADIEGLGYQFIGLADGYISSVINTDNTTLAAGTNGDYSTWMYAVNDTSPYIGIAEYVLNEGDSIKLYYLDDYRPIYGMIVYGDADGDNKFTANDSALVLQAALDTGIVLAAQWRKDMDVDGDGLITGGDAAYILQKAGINTFLFPVEQ